MFSISQIFQQSSEFFKGGAVTQQLFTSIYSSDEKQKQQIPEIFEILEILTTKNLQNLDFLPWQEPELMSMWSLKVLFHSTKPIWRDFFLFPLFPDKSCRT